MWITVIQQIVDELKHEHFRDKKEELLSDLEGFY